MRLLNTETLAMKAWYDHWTGPEYAILSHTWGRKEVTFQDMGNLKTARLLEGFSKIKRCCKVARELGYEWVWIDTCCIDKSSSAELSEAINSMFSYYNAADRCIAYLSDVPFLGLDTAHDPAFEKSRWFTRGWRLQELIAPMNLTFYAKDWSEIGEKKLLLNRLSAITSIDANVLERPWTRQGYRLCIAQRMSWASRRETTRGEDMAYCLMGIFDVNMPLLYGEGEKKAFRRLQGEISKNSDDPSLFAWTSTICEHFEDSEEVLH